MGQPIKHILIRWRNTCPLCEKSGTVTKGICDHMYRIFRHLWTDLGAFIG